MSAALVTNVDARQLRKTKFPPEFNEKVDMTKVQTQIIKKWVSDEITKILNNDDDVIIELVSNMLDERYPKIKELQISLTGFLDKDAASFCHRMWKLCLSAQQSPQGIPKELLEAKKQELAQSRIEEERAREEIMARQQAERVRDGDRERLRERERGERRGRGGRDNRDNRDYRPPRHSPSPPPRRRRESDDFYRPHPAARGGDTYRPVDRSRRPHSATRSRSPPRRSRRRSPSIRSPSPPPPARNRRRSPSTRSPSPPPRRVRRRSPSTASPSPPPRRRRRRNTSSDGSMSPAPHARHGDRHSSSRRDSTPPRHSDRRPRVAGGQDLIGASPDGVSRRGNGTMLGSGRLSREPSDTSSDVSETPDRSGKEARTGKE